MSKENLKDDAMMRILMRQIAEGVKEKFLLVAREWQEQITDLYVTFRIKDTVQEPKAINDWFVMVNSFVSKRQAQFLDNQQDHNLIDAFDALLPEFKEMMDNIISTWDVTQHQCFLLMWYKKEVKDGEEIGDTIGIKIKTVKSLPQEKQRTMDFE